MSSCALVEIDQMDVLDILNDDGGMKPIAEWPKVWRTSLSAMDIATIKTTQASLQKENGEADLSVEDVEHILKKVKWPDKVKNLELIGKHVDVNAFKERPWRFPAPSPSPTAWQPRAAASKSRLVVKNDSRSHVAGRAARRGYRLVHARPAGLCAVCVPVGEKRAQSWRTPPDRVNGRLMGSGKYAITCRIPLRVTSR